MTKKATPIQKERTLEVSAEPRTRALSFGPSSIKEDTGIVTATFATDTPVRSWHYRIGDYFEVLGFEPGMVRMDRINTAAPILDNHRRYEKKLGIVHAARLENKSLVGELRYDIGGEAGKEAFRQVKEGFTKTVSVGYRVHAMQEIGERDGIPTMLVTDWEPLEVSNADIPADIRSSMRSEDTNSQNKLTITSTKPFMKTKEEEGKGTDTRTEDQISQEQASIRAEAQTAERTRVAEINKLCKLHGIDDEARSEFIEKGTDIDGVRTAILEAKVTAQPQIKAGGKENGFKSEQDRADAMVEGVMVRMDEKKFALPAERKDNPFRQVTLMEMCDNFLREKNLDTTGSPRQRAQRAMNYGARAAGSMTTSDFPLLFANVLKKTLTADYGFEFRKWLPLTFKQDASRVNVNEKTVELGDFTQMEKVLEGAEYKAQVINEAGENFMVNKYGSEVKITLEMIINDDLGGILRMAQKVQKMNYFTEDYIVWNLLLANPKMSDGKAVFHTDHGNLGTGGALDITKLKELRKKIRTQTGLNSKPIDLDPQFFVGGVDNEDTISQLLSSAYVPTTSSGVVPPYIKSIKPIITNYITDGSYYLSASPNQIDTIRVGGLSGEPEFAVEEHYEYKNDSYIHHVRKFFGAAFVNYRGMAKNAGS